MVNNHGDPKSPKDRVVPLPNGHFMALNMGGPNYLLHPGMILQVGDHLEGPHIKALSYKIWEENTQKPTGCNPSPPG